MELNFVKLSPTQNMTILVETPVPRDLQSAAADALMDYSNVFAEQVGFLETPGDASARVRLQMMGGEFCGNASMSCASYLAYRDGLADNSKAVYPIEVSGADRLVYCRIRRTGSSYQGTVSMPVPTSVREVQFANGLVCPVVFFPGIAHAILPEAVCDDASMIAGMCEELDCEAFGILRTDFDACRIRPLVYVRSTRSAIYERGCGSGSAALVAYLAANRRRSAEADIRQPGGLIHARAEFKDNSVSAIEITGTVKISAIGTAFIDL